MAAENIGYSTQEDDVKRLQTMLNNNGYALDVDGIYGEQTQAAMEDYQKKSGLLGGGTEGNAAAPVQTGSKTNTSGGFSYDAYTPSDNVLQAEALLQQQLGKKPGAYQSAYGDQLGTLLDDIVNRDKFSYDLNQDALYQQYADQYVQRGKLAMMDTMGQAAALTGGYGNSYAQTVGQQAYQEYLQQLNEVVPELYQMALQRYNQEGEDLYNQYALLGDREAQEYGRYQDIMNEYMAELDRLQSLYNQEREYDYGKWADERDFAYDQYADDRAYEYQAGRDQVADEQWQAEFDEDKRRYDQEYGLALQQYSSGGSSSGGGNLVYDVDDGYDAGDAEEYKLPAASTETINSLDVFNRHVMSEGEFMNQGGQTAVRMPDGEVRYCYDYYGYMQTVLDKLVIEDKISESGAMAVAAEYGFKLI